MKQPEDGGQDDGGRRHWWRRRGRSAGTETPATPPTPRRAPVMAVYVGDIHEHGCGRRLGDCHCN